MYVFWAECERRVQTLAPPPDSLIHDWDEDESVLCDNQCFVNGLICSYGVLLWSMVTGREPYSGKRPSAALSSPSTPLSHSCPSRRRSVQYGALPDPSGGQTWPGVHRPPRDPRSGWYGEAHDWMLASGPRQETVVPLWDSSQSLPHENQPRRLLTSLSLCSGCVNETQKILQMHKHGLNDAVYDVLKLLVQFIFCFIHQFCQTVWVA